MPRTSIKGQVLADLVAKFTECPEEMEGGSKKLDEGSIVWPLFNAQCLRNCTLMEQLINEDQEWG